MQVSYKDYLFKDFKVKGIVKDKQENKGGDRYRFITGYLGQIGFDTYLRWTYRKIRNVVDEIDRDFPSIGIVFIEKRRRATEAYAVTMEIGEKGEKLKVIKDFVKSYFSIDIKGE